MRINNNLMAQNTQRYLNVNESGVSKSIEKLSSGFAINRAGDDAAGLAISEKMRGQIRGLDMSSKNAQDAISLIQTAEGALTETQSILQRMGELAVQSASDTNETAVDRDALQQEFSALQEEIDDISTQTKFNGKSLLNGSFGGVPTSDAKTKIVTTSMEDFILSEKTEAGDYFFSAVNTAGSETLSITHRDAGNNIITQTLSVTDGSQKLNFDTFGVELDLNASFTAAGVAAFDGRTVVVTAAASSATFQVGANKGEELSLSIGDMSTTGLSIGNTIKVDTRANASSAILSVQTSVNKVSSERAKLGAFQNRLEHKIKNLNTSAENLNSAESRIRDVDMADEMMSYTKYNILQQAATSMLAQANQAPNNVLKLLQ